MRHVGLHALGVEDARRQPQQRVHVEVGQQPAPKRLPDAALEERVVRYDHRSELMSRIVAMCCTKFSCWLAVVTTKSYGGRWIRSASSLRSEKVMLRDRGSE